MGNFQWFDYLRVVVACMALAAFLLSMRTAKKQWDNYTAKHKDLWWSLNAFLLLAVEGSIEQIITDSGYGPRTILGAGVCVVSLRGQLRKNAGYLKIQ